MILCHPPDGSTSPKDKLLCFITTKFFCKEKNALSFNRDRCCHLVLCLRLIPFHYYAIFRKPLKNDISSSFFTFFWLCAKRKSNNRLTRNGEIAQGHLPTWLLVDENSNWQNGLAQSLRLMLASCLIFFWQKNLKKVKKKKKYLFFVIRFEIKSLTSKESQKINLIRLKFETFLYPLLTPP